MACILKLLYSQFMSQNFKKVNYDIYDDIESILEHEQARTFRCQTDLIYKGHIPHAAYLLVDGGMFIKDKGYQVPLEKGAVIGIDEILNNKPFRYDVIVEGGSEIIILDKSTICELSQDGHLHSIVKDFNFKVS